MIVWIPLLKKLMFRRLMTSPPSEIVTRARRDLVALRRLRPARERQATPRGCFPP